MPPGQALAGKALVVVDAGTSATKAYLFDWGTGAVLAESRVDVPFQVPEPGAAEVDPALWWDGLCRTVRGVLEAQPGVQVQGFALTNQQISCVFLDGAGEPVAPALLWMDTRCTGDVQLLRERCQREGRGIGWVFEATGIPPSDSWGLAKLLWFRRRFPGQARRIRHVLSVDAYLLHRLCGRLVADETNACFFHYHIQKRGPARELLGFLGLEEAWFPEVVPPGTVVGRVSAEAAAATGLPAGLPVVAAASDQPCAVLGMGVYRAGEAVVNLGTGTFFLTPLDEPLLDIRLMTNYSAVAGRWLMMGTHYLTGGALSWLRDVLRAGGASVDYAGLDQAAAAVPPGSEGLVFLPFLSGSGTPHWNPGARGLFAGLGLGHGLGHMVRAVMESTGYGLRAIMDTYRELGVALERLVIAGGPTASAVWPQALADILQVPLERSPVKEATPLGAAMLAAVALGRFGTVEGAIAQWVGPGQAVAPRPEVGPTYDGGYAQYLAWVEAEARIRGRGPGSTG